MKKIPKIAIYLALGLIIFLFPDQSDYYLSDDLLSLTFIQGVIIVLILFIISAFLWIWDGWGENPWYENLASAIATTFVLSSIGLLFVQPVVKQGTLLLNRIQSSESVIQKQEIWGSYGLLALELSEEKKDTVFIWLRDKLPDLYDKNRKGKDSVSIQLEKGLFGYYYINREKSKLISSEK